MIVDAFMWSYEREAVELRLKVLSDVVDTHIAVQATNTFRGKDRKTDIIEHPNLHNVIVTIPDGLDPWESEKWLRDEIFRWSLKLFGADATYIISDGDEIPHPEAILAANTPRRLMTDYRNFYADWRAIDHALEHQPTIGTGHDYLEVGGAGNARWRAGWPMSQKAGWHLSSLGDTSKEKLSTFAHTEYDTPEHLSGVDSAKERMRDFLDRFDLEYTDDYPPETPSHLLGGVL